MPNPFCATSIKATILTYLEANGPTFGGVLERAIGDQLQKKSSNVGRRCRELEEDGWIVSEYVHVPDVPNSVVRYRLTGKGQPKGHVAYTVEGKGVVARAPSYD